MAFETWDPKTKYWKQEACTCGCSDPKDCSCKREREHGCECEDKDNNDGCGCPPAGLVSVYDGDGTFCGFLTPNDAQGFYLNISVPPDGFMKLMKTGTFYGYVSPADWATTYPLLP